MKLTEMREKEPVELEQRERELREQLFKLRFQRATGSLEDPNKMRQVRREIAKIKTILRERTGGADAATR
jgi:large subunit ribosomal protein L29